MMTHMKRRNEGFVGLSLTILCLALSASCAPEREETAEERFRRIVDISRDDEALKEYLKSVPPKTPAEALETFETADGFRTELVAHEPMVNEPVAATFDESGRMYVAELRSYPYQPGGDEEPRGRVRLLEDRDGDGRFDVSHVFAEGLIWPTGGRRLETGRLRLRTPQRLLPEGQPTATGRPTSRRSSTPASASPTSNRW